MFLASCYLNNIFLNQDEFYVNIKLKPCEYESMTTTVANSVSTMESYPRLVVTTGEIIGRRGAAVTWLKKRPV